MKLFCFATLLLSLALAYYVYTPMPETISEPWKLMILDTAIRSMMHVGALFQTLGICHQVHVVRFVQQMQPMPSGDTKVQDSTFAGVQVRVYEGTGGEEGRLRRGMVYLHGGGWALASTKERSYDHLCRKMADELKAVIVSVEYRLAPEVHFPKQYDDCLEATKHFLTPEVLALYSVDPAHVGIAGDSAGGNLAAAVAQQISVDDTISVKLRVQALIYPVLQALDFNTPSYQQNHNIPILYRSSMVHFWLEYLDADRTLIHTMLINNHTAKDQKALSKHRAKFDWTALLSPEFQKNYKAVVPRKGSPKILKKVPALLDVRAAPLLAEEEVLQKTPQAYVLTCEHDVLRDDGMMYARRLEQAGVKVTSDHYADGFHGCLSFASDPIKFSVGERALQNYISWLNDNL
ncbi:neutral cholesterol ester hydrolase 1a [Alosa pseudoharengus]|uniref:neutral cholesterol ester hydrolase 1a n=1 Tax=Alosa pseudoharengus TaxID=34774 RepID=UPI003F8BF4F1